MKLTVSTADAIDWEADDQEQVRNNLLNLLRTRRGEVPYMPTFGLDPDLVGKPITTVTAQLRSDIQEQIAKWMPEIDLDSVTITADENGNLEVEVEYQ